MTTLEQYIRRAYLENWYVIILANGKQLVDVMRRSQKPPIHAEYDSL